MRHPLATAAVTLLALVVSATAAVADVTDRWVAVDAVEITELDNNNFGYPYLSLTGLREGTDTAETHAYGILYSFHSERRAAILQRCEKLALLALSRPGRYVLEIVRSDATVWDMVGCRLVRND